MKRALVEAHRDLALLLVHGEADRVLPPINAAEVYRAAVQPKEVELKQQGVDARFIYELRDAGYERLSAHDLVEARQQGVSAAFIKELREAGYGGLSLDDLVEARQQGVDAAFVTGIRSLGFGELTLDQLVEAKQQGLDSEYVREMRGVVSAERG